jgi:hypothetical protein
MVQRDGVGPVPHGGVTGVVDSFRREALEAIGFVGWVPFRVLPESRVPDAPGVYVVHRVALDVPAFLAVSPAGHFKGRDPTVDVLTLKGKWVEAVSAIYVGKATSLRSRLSQYRRYGSGQAVGHQGGRYIWQLSDSDSHLVAWKTTDRDPGAEEAALLRLFFTEHGQLPFANLNAGAREGSSPLAGARGFGATTDRVRESVGAAVGGSHPVSRCITFTLGGKRVTLSAQDVAHAMMDVRAEPIKLRAVEINGTLYPVVQAFERATGLPRGLWRSARAWELLPRLGFRTLEVP